MIIADLFVRAPLVALAGETSTKRQVTGVRVAARTAGATLSPGELLVLLDPDRTAWRLDAELSRVAEAGAAGLLVPGTEPLLRSTVLLADRLEMPVLGCGEDPLETAMRLAVLVASPEVDVARRILAAHRVLDAGATALAEMRDRTSAVLGTEVTVLARDGAVLLGPAIPARVRTTVPVRQRLTGGGVAVPVLAPDGRTPELWLVTGGTAGEAATGSAAVAGDEEVLAVAAAAVQRSLALRRVDVERDARRRSGLLGELLQAGDDPGPSLRRRAAEAGWRLDGWHTGIRIGVSRSVDVVALSTDVVSALAAEGVAAVVVAEDDGWMAWVTNDTEPGPGPVNRLAARVRQAQRRLADLDLHVGMARPHLGPGGIARTLSEARDAARLAGSRVETGRFLHVDRLGLAQLLLAWTRTDTFVPAAKALLATLDSEPGDLIRTLTVYLDAESSLIEAAAVLGVHRNTIARRIAKIGQLLGVDLTDPDTRLALHLACRVARI
ncbi:PucR C-terminal helix-turn-helix domain-containing protein [Streptosporangium subroseum]|uniref:PucR C-terminal helix-turn-helix domain-containing protein n=1 Tax=Streptosporangium subroseum TaxID=106412 RepID=A0A239CDH0_9ACTN|nr:helix-turn-helix domain-containing protein [Streptosporangium subroseum]SNS18265.1 PucR C-terminal helix-turn-helix domain-containing protein [Streptosporangium subroseum]